ncbi:MAG: YlbF family regulator [Mogibacterium sp.]|nr:YlbF family regulator [Mogibacterium sp.]
MFARFQSLSTMVMTKPLAAQYLQAQMAIGTMMNDVFSIVGEAIADK